MIEENTKKVLAVFDFDGTITTKDTLFDFIRFYHGMPRMIAGLVIFSPVLILFKLGIISNEKAKQVLLSYFFKGKSITEFDAVCEKYKDRISEILRPEAIEKIKYHEQHGHILVINSASVCNWIIPWAHSMEIHCVIGTRLEIRNGMITGKFDGKNNNGIEKVDRLLDLFPDRKAYQLYVYGDSTGDKPLLDIADFPYYRKF